MFFYEHFFYCYEIYVTRVQIHRDCMTVVMKKLDQLTNSRIVFKLLILTKMANTIQCIKLN